ncbi:sulfate adenylyltransferase subunit CysN [bacterium SCSIO 12696]|nr:sulfate adenylyltransferase subunit CysN [bacterium SCSIO 12696]
MNAHTALIQTNVEAYLQQHEQKDILRFITCGSVDDGKSTLIGRMLHDSKTVYQDQLAAIEKDSKTVGTTGEAADLALLVDGLQSEREQGITIDVAYRYFSSELRKFIIADTPGHEQYTRNMATGASSADLAVLLIDARYGVQAQTRRHSYICSLLGIRHFVVAINKMDLVDYSETVFENIKNEFQALAERFPQVENYFVPLSALAGDNVVQASNHMPWYQGDTLLGLLNHIDVSVESQAEELRLPVQYVNRPHLNFRGYCGTLASGELHTGQVVTALPSGQTSTVKEILVGNQAVAKAIPGQALTVTLNDEIDISRGDQIVGEQHQATISDEFKAHIVWMNEDELVPGKRYDFKMGTRYISGTVSALDWQLDINSLEKQNASELPLNGIGEAHISLTEAVVYDTYQSNRTTGSFVVIDRLTNATVGAGMISKVLDKKTDDTADNVDQFASEVTPQMRASIKPHNSRCVWTSNLTDGHRMEVALHRQGFHTYLLDLNYDSPAALKPLLEAGLIVVVVSNSRDLETIKTALQCCSLTELPNDRIDTAMIDSVIQQCSKD